MCHSLLIGFGTSNESGGCAKTRGARAWRPYCAPRVVAQPSNLLTWQGGRDAWQNWWGDIPVCLTTEGFAKPVQQGVLETQKNTGVWLQPVCFYIPSFNDLLSLYLLYLFLKYCGYKLLFEWKVSAASVVFMLFFPLYKLFRYYDLLCISQVIVLS